MSFEAELSSGWLRLSMIRQIWMGTWEAGVFMRCVSLAVFVGYLLIVNHLWAARPWPSCGEEGYRAGVFDLVSAFNTLCGYVLCGRIG